MRGPVRIRVKTPSRMPVFTRSPFRCFLCCGISPRIGRYGCVLGVVHRVMENGPMASIERLHRTAPDLAKLEEDVVSSLPAIRAAPSGQMADHFEPEEAIP